MVYNDMTDFEINKAVAEIMYGPVEERDINACSVPDVYHDGGEVYLVNPDRLSGAWRQFNPCNAWSQAGPIIEKNKINIEWGDNKSAALIDVSGATKRIEIGGKSYRIVHEHKNSLRAAMVVFLIMQEAKAWEGAPGEP
ncbi:hypothetical protein C3408_22405 [Candidatus Pantoea alvi]|nr:hypothetical protein C3408_22405 [Pantoea alvi]